MTYYYRQKPNSPLIDVSFCDYCMSISTKSKTFDYHYVHSMLYGSLELGQLYEVYHNSDVPYFCGDHCKSEHLALQNMV